MKHLILSLSCIFCLSFLHAEIPAGYYQNADNKSKKVLLDALNNIISNGQFLSYGSGEGHTWQGFHFTDRDSVTGTIIDRYSNCKRSQSGYNSVDSMHIEHALPKSWWGASYINAYKDLHNLYPADGITNINKNNIPLGIVGSDTSFFNGVSTIGETNIIGTSGRCFEPADEFKGDFARAYFYVITAYNEVYINWQSPMLDNNAYPTFTPWAINLLLQWHRKDPVSKMESDRNDAVYNIQGNRNPFIDFPEIAEHIWGKDTAKTFYFPAETRPYITSPNKWSKMEFGTNLQNTSISKSLNIAGANFSSDITLNLKNKNQNISIADSIISPSEINNGIDIAISINAENLGEIIDTIVISNEEINSLYIPVHAIVTSQFMALPDVTSSATSASISCMALPNNTSYEFILESDKTEFAGNLIIASYIEGSAWNKAIEIFNGTGATVDLSFFSLRKQSNGEGAFYNEMKLQGMLPHNESYILVHGAAADSLKAMADTITGNNQEDILSFNGNDAIALCHNNLIIDMVGIKNQASEWGEDMTLIRIDNIIHPYNDFICNEWTKMPANYMAQLNTRSLSSSNNASISKHTSSSNEITLTDLIPNSEYVFSAKTADMQTVNKVRFFTAHIPATEAFVATEVYCSQFRANWDVVPEAEGYVVNVFSLAAGDSISVSENFNDIDSKGKPLPLHWSGTASGRYTTSTSSGKEPNALSLKNDNEYLQSPSFPSDIRNISFLCRFPSGSSDSYLLLEGIAEDGSYIVIDSIKASSLSNTKTTMSYSLEDFKCRALKWTYSKDRGNCALDDIEFKYCAMDTTVIYTSPLVTENSLVVTNLTDNSSYFYNVQVGIAEQLSAVSNTIAVSTNSDSVPVNTPNISTENMAPIAYVNNGIINIQNLKDASILSLYSINGSLICQDNITVTGSSHKTWNISSLPLKGIYILHIQGRNQSSAHKIIF